MEKEYIIKSPNKVSVFLTKRSITISRKGFVNLINHGIKGNKTIPLKNITAVQFKEPGITNGYIQFSVLGGTESKGGIFSATQDENTIMYSKKHYEEVLDLKHHVENYIFRDEGNEMNSKENKNVSGANYDTQENIIVTEPRSKGDKNMSKKKLFDEDGNEVTGKLKKPFYKRVWFWIFVVILAFIFLPTGDSEESSSNNAAADTTSSTNETETLDSEESSTSDIAGIGDTVTVEDVDFVVNGLETLDNIGGEYGKNAQGTFLLIDITVTNNSAEALNISDSYFKLLNDGKEFESDSTAAIYANEDDSFFISSINPDLSMTGKVVFDVSGAVLDSTTKQLEVTTDYFSSDSAVINLH